MNNAPTNELPTSSSAREEAVAPGGHPTQPSVQKKLATAAAPPQSWLRVGVALLVVGGGLTAVGTLAGWLYWVGYLSMFEIPSEVFPQQVMELLLNNYSMLFVVLGKALDALNSKGPSLVLAAGMSGLAIAASVRFLLWPPVERATQSARSWARKHLQGPNLFCAAIGGAAATATVVVPVALMMSTTLVLTLPLVAYGAGRSQGAKSWSTPSATQGLS